MIMSTKENKLRIGVCGIGSIGFRHARLLSQRNDIALYLCDTTRAHLDSAARLPHLEKVTESFEELLDQKLDGLIIATPDQFHIQQAIAACRKGAAVLIEKPVSENTEQAAVLQQYMRDETNTRVLIGYPLRYNGIFLKAKELFDAGLLGEPLSFHIMLGAYNTLVVAKNRFNPTDENKLFIDYSHEWDYLQWFLGKVRRVAAVSHQSGNLERTQKPNIVNCLLELESGATGTAHLDYVQAPGQRCFTIIGDKGTLTIDAVKGLVSLNIYNDGFEREYRVAEHFDVMMERQHEHFIEIVRSGNNCRVTVEDGLNALRVADALILSCESSSWQSVIYNSVQ
jgi:predicted dehydrogenase